MQLNLEVSDDGGVVFAENQLVDIFTLYDVQYYINADGSLTFED